MKVYLDMDDETLNEYRAVKTEKIYYLYCSSRFDKTGEYQNVDDVDFLLDKVNEFLIYLKEIR
jgi:hypothetical protein